MKAAFHSTCLFFHVAMLSLCASESVPFPDVLWVARERSESGQCVSRLKLIGYAARVWQSENGDVFPPGFSVLTNELTPSTLFCSANYRRQPPATNWVDFDWNSIDYVWIAPTNQSEPREIFSRCKIHHNVGRVDGSADLLPGFKPGWPRILAPPLSQHAATGSLVRFEFVLTNAAAPFHIQWNREDPFWGPRPVFVETNETGDGYWRTNYVGTNTPIPNATNRELVIASTGTNDAGYYSFIISNELGSAKTGLWRLYVPQPQFQTPLAELLCRIRLRQIHLAANLWSSEHADEWPLSLRQVTNDIGYPLFGWPMLLFCPADTNRIAPVDWSSVDFTNTSYEVLLTNSLPHFDAEAEAEPFARCRVHGFVVSTHGTIESALALRFVAHTNGEIAFTVRNPSRRSFEIQASTNLVQWTTVFTATNGTGDYFFAEATATEARRFYRAIDPMP